MSSWPSTPARRVLAALQRIGWSIKRERGSHRVLAREGWTNVVFAFHDSEEIGPRMLARIARRTGLTPEDLYPRAFAVELGAGADARCARAAQRLGRYPGVAFAGQQSLAVLAVEPVQL